MTRLEEIDARLKELYATDNRATGWGAAVGARAEEIQELEGEKMVLIGKQKKQETIVSEVTEEEKYKMLFVLAASKLLEIMTAPIPELKIVHIIDDDCPGCKGVLELCAKHYTPALLSHGAKTPSDVMRLLGEWDIIKRMEERYNQGMENRNAANVSDSSQR